MSLGALAALAPVVKAALDVARLILEERAEGRAGRVALLERLFEEIRNGHEADLASALDAHAAAREDDHVGRL